MIEDLKQQVDQDHEQMQQRVSALQKKVDTNAKFVIGAGAVLATLVAVLQVVPPIVRLLTAPESSVSMDLVNPVVRELS